MTRLVGASCLAALRPGHDYRPALDENRALGFGLVRVFCGPLPWCGQERGHVYDRLGGFLTDCRDRGMHAYLSYCTEAGTGYDLEAHVRSVEAITNGRDNVLREVANEPWHPTQGGRLSPDRCRELASLMRAPVGYGAAEDDESPQYSGGAFTPWHRDRGRDLWNDVRREREGLALQEQTGDPVFDQEGKGAAEQSEPGKREANSHYFFTQTALMKLFGLGGSIFHSEDGLWARQLGPNQRRCAERFLEGARLIPDTPKLTYKNAGHDGSPVRSATFNDGDMGREGCTRAYSGIDGDTGYTVALGISGNPGIEWNWNQRETIADLGDVRVWRVSR